MEGSTPPRRTSWGLLLLALLPIALFAGSELILLGGETGFPLDDSWIHLQFARQLSEGHGLAYRPGEPVTGSTAPLWTALLALLALLPGGGIVAAKLLGVLLHLGTVDATRRLALELGAEEAMARLAACLVLATSWLVWGALSGMEIPLFTLLSLWGVLLCVRERRSCAALPRGPVVLAVAALARPEGLALLLLALVDGAFRPRTREEEWRLSPPPGRWLATGALGSALVLVPILASYLWLGGSVLPTTYGVKAGSGLGWPSMRFLYVAAGVFARAQPWALLFAGAGALALARRLGGTRDRGLLPALWVAALPSAYAVLSPPGKELLGNFGRYLFPLFPFVVILGLLGLEGAAELVRHPLRWGALRIPLRPFGLALLLAPTCVALLSGAGLYARAVANVQDSDVRLARLLAERLPPEAVLAVQDVGAIGVLLPNPLVDLAGIVTPEVRLAVLASVTDEDPRGSAGMWAFLVERRPDYLAVWPAWHPDLTRRLRPVLELPVSDNVAMAGDRLTLYATPWTRYPLAQETPP